MTPNPEAGMTHARESTYAIQATVTDDINIDETEAIVQAAIDAACAEKDERITILEDCLAEAAEKLQAVVLIGQVKAIGLRQVPGAIDMLIAEKDAEIERVTAVAKKNHDLAEECERKYYLEMNAKDDAQDDVATLTTQLAVAVEALDEVQRLLLPMFDGMNHDEEDCPCDDTCECGNVACVNMVAAKVAEALRQIGATDG